MARHDTARTGAAGAHHAGAQLSERDWDASLTIGNAPRTDIIAQHHRHQLLIAVQSKASKGARKFVLGENCELPSLPGRNEWFILVALGGAGARPNFFIIPRNVVAAYVFIMHRVWFEDTHRRDGEPRKRSTLRDVHHAAVKHYHERWDLLEQSPESVPHWLPDCVFDWEPWKGLPAGHPGLPRPADGVISDEVASWVPPWMPPLPASPDP